LDLRANIGGYQEDGQAVAGLGAAEVFRDTVLKDGAVIAVGGDDFTHDLVLHADSRDSLVHIDADAVFRGVVDIGLDSGNALVVAGATEDTRLAVDFHQDVIAGDIGLHNATVSMAEGTTFTTNTLTAGRNSVLDVRGDATIQGNAVFAGGSRLKLGTNTLAIRGDATFAADSTYDARLGEDKTALVAVDNDVTIEDGARIRLGGVTLDDAASKTVLTAGGTLTGTFENKLYELETRPDNSIAVTGIRKTGDVLDLDAPLYSSNISIKNAAELYDRITRDTSLSEDYRSRLLAALEEVSEYKQVDGEAGNVAVSQLFGQHAITAGESIKETSRAFRSGVGNRLTVIHQARAGGGAGGTASAASDNALADLGGGYYDDHTVVDAMDRLWVGALGAWGKQDNRYGTYGYKYDSQGVIAGYDWERGDFTIGASVGWTTGDMRTNDLATHTDVDTMNVGLYASYDPVSGFFADANVGYGRSWNKASTIVTGSGGGTRNGNFSNSAMQAGLNMGYTLECAEFRITPTLGLQWTRVKQDGWTESGTGTSLINNWFGDSNHDYVEVPIAMRLSRAFQFANGVVVTPEARAAYIANIGDSAPTIRMGYVGSSDSTTLHGIDPGAGRGVVGGGVKANINHFLDADFDYNYEFRSGYRNNSFTGGVGLSF
ncbi:MAG: autotransporter domain-containing protein, partial [Planctomycetes bacterium]|nr:autotransporter domain-containing protein [Planctomycetota bacterium]